MSCLSSFNVLLSNFLDELSQVFPEDKKLKVYKNLFETFVSTKPDLPLKIWVDTLGKEANLIIAKDPALFDKHPMLFDSIDIKTMWESDISDANRDVIWQYMSTLNVLAQTISALPPDMLATVETMAQGLAQGLEGGGMAGMDFGKLFSSFAGMMGPPPTKARAGPKALKGPK